MSIEARHTQGPWYAKGCGVYAGIDKDSVLIAATGGDSSKDQDVIQQKADAILIAAAPEMYALLKECVDGTFGDCTYWNRRARKLLNKATQA